MSVSLRTMVNDFEGDTKLIGRLVQQLGGYDEFVKHYKALSKERADAVVHNLRVRKEDTNPPRIGPRMENLAHAGLDREAKSKAAERLQAKPDVKHAEVKPVLEGWYLLKGEIDALSASQADSPEYLAELIEKAKRFIADAKERRETIHAETLSSVRYRDSLGEVDATVKLAETELAALGKRFEATSGEMSRQQQNMVPSAKDLAVYDDTVDSQGKKIVDERNRGGKGPTQEEELQTVKGRRDATKGTGVRTENQAWALVGAEKKGEAEQPYFRLKALGRLEQLNRAFGTSYSEPHLDQILDYVAKQKLASNYWLSKKPGENIDQTASEGTPLYKLLTDPSNKHFKNVWETGKSQASTELDRRGGVEEAMGYSDALIRQYESNDEATVKLRKKQPAMNVPKKAEWGTGSDKQRGDVVNTLTEYTIRPDDAPAQVVKLDSELKFLDAASADAPKRVEWTEGKGKKQGQVVSKEVSYNLRPDDGSANVLKKESEVTLLPMFDVLKEKQEPTDKEKDKGEMPKYAALVDERQKHGVAPRYGDSFIIWKESVRERVTHTPGDSWNTLEQGVKYFTSNKHPEVLVANADTDLIRLAAAACTGQDTKWLSETTAKGLGTDAYMETQIHGDLTWDDVDTVVVGGGDADMLFDHFEKFKQSGGYEFRVKKK